MKIADEDRGIKILLHTYHLLTAEGLRLKNIFLASNVGFNTPTRGINFYKLTRIITLFLHKLAINTPNFENGNLRQRVNDFSDVAK